MEMGKSGPAMGFQNELALGNNRIVILPQDQMPKNRLGRQMLKAILVNRQVALQRPGQRRHQHAEQPEHPDEAERHAGGEPHGAGGGAGSGRSPRCSRPGWPSPSR